MESCAKIKHDVNAWCFSCCSKNERNTNRKGTFAPGVPASRNSHPGLYGRHIGIGGGATGTRLGHWHWAVQPRYMDGPRTNSMGQEWYLPMSQRRQWDWHPDSLTSEPISLNPCYTRHTWPRRKFSHILSEKHHTEVCIVGSHSCETKIVCTPSRLEIYGK